MFRDLGFIWLLTKEFVQGGLAGLWIVSMIAMHFAPAPWDTVAFVYNIAGFFYFVVPMLKTMLEWKYKAYRKEKEKAWDMLKDSK